MQIKSFLGGGPLVELHLGVLISADIIPTMTTTLKCFKYVLNNCLWPFNAFKSQEIV